MKQPRKYRAPRHFHRRPTRTLAIAPAVLCVGWGTLPCRANQITTLDVQSRVETYEYASDTLNAVVLNPVLFSSTPLAFVKLGVGLWESYATGCGQFDFWGARITNDGGDMTFDFQTSASTVIGAAGVGGSLAIGGISFNNIAQNLVPTVMPCGPTDVQTKMGGDTSVYVAHAGTGGYKRKINSGVFRVCRTVQIDNRSGETIVLPVHISGSATSAVSLAPDATTFARSKLRMSGAVGASSFDESIVSDGANGFPDDKAINVTREVPVCTPNANTTVTYDITGEFSVDVSAKGIGFWGLVTQSASASVNFPNTIAIRNFKTNTAATLPPNVVIRVAGADGAVLADTTMRLRIVTLGAEQVVLGVHGATGRTYRIQHSTDLSQWADVGQPFSLTSPAQEVTVFRSSGAAGFYRLAYP